MIDVLPNVDRGGYFLDTRYHDKIISIREIKTGSYR